MGEQLAKKEWVSWEPARERDREQNQDVTMKKKRHHTRFFLHEFWTFMVWHNTRYTIRQSNSYPHFFSLSAQICFNSNWVRIQYYMSCVCLCGKMTVLKFPNFFHRYKTEAFQLFTSNWRFKLYQTYFNSKINKNALFPELKHARHLHYTYLVHIKVVSIAIHKQQRCFSPVYT